MELRGKTAIVTGGARGIGRGIAVALAHQGVAVAVADLYTPTQGTGGYALSTEADVEETVEILTRQGRIINTSSVAGKTGSYGLAAYSASKSAVIGFTQSLALEMASYNITVNAVCPGILGTSMWLDHIIEKRSQEVEDDREAALQRFVSDRIPLGRPQTPEDMVVYLAQADNVTEISLNVAGGLVMH